MGFPSFKCIALFRLSVAFTKKEKKKKGKPDPFFDFYTGESIIFLRCPPLIARLCFSPC